MIAAALLYLIGVMAAFVVGAFVGGRRAAKECGYISYNACSKMADALFGSDDKDLEALQNKMHFLDMFQAATHEAVVEAPKWRKHKGTGVS